MERWGQDSVEDKVAGGQIVLWEEGARWKMQGRYVNISLCNEERQGRYGHIDWLVKDWRVTHPSIPELDMIVERA